MNPVNTLPATATSALRLGDVEISKQHRGFFITGGPGSGKTTATLELLNQISSEGEAAIVYDVGGIYADRLYNAQRGDIVMSTLDQRSSGWSVVADAESFRDLSELAALLTPIHNLGDPDEHWLNASRILLSAILQALLRDRETGNEPLRRAIFDDDFDLPTLLQGTCAERLANSTRGCSAVRHALAARLSWLKTLKDGPSISRFVRDPGHRMIFLEQDGTTESRDLPAVWLGIAARQLLERDRTTDAIHAISIALDDAACLHCIPDSLSVLAAQAAENRAQFVMATQAAFVAKPGPLAKLCLRQTVRVILRTDPSEVRMVAQWVPAMNEQEISEMPPLQALITSHPSEVRRAQLLPRAASEGDLPLAA